MRAVSSALAVLLACGAGAPTYAQLGPGWVPYSPTKRIHLDDDVGLQTFSWSPYQSVCSPAICADYTYDSATDTETFRIFDSRSNRSEIRLQNDYSTGRRQFEGYVTFYPPLENESLMQIFGSTTGATLTMTRGYAANGGSITVTSTGGGVTYGNRTIATNCYGVELRINIIHDQDNYVRWYVNGLLKCEQRDTEVGVGNYHKYGCYGTTSGNVPAIVQWRAVRCFKDGYPPGPDVVAHPNRLTVAQGASASGQVNVSAFGADTSLVLSGAPAGAIASFSPAIITNGQGSATLTVATAPGIAPGSFPLTIIALGGGINKTATLILGVVPQPWVDSDIGGPGQDGGAGYSNGLFTVHGSGNDIWGAADKFNFAYQTFSGDLAMSGRVETQDNTDGWAKSGLMVRETTNAGSKYLAIYVTPGNGVSMQYRPTNNAAAVDFARNTGLTAPYWLGLVRAGNVFTGYRSADGASWTPVGSLALALASDVLIGLPVTAHNDSALNTTTFSHVLMPPNFSISPAPLSRTLISGGSTTWQLGLTNLNGFSSTVAFTAAGLPTNSLATFDPPTLTGNGSSLLTLTTSNNTPAGVYTIALVGLGGGLVRSNSVTLIVSTPGSNLLWNSTSSPLWDTTTPNWFSEELNAGDIFQQSNQVAFTDRPGVVTDITIPAGLAVIPTTLTVDSDTNNYTIGGAGKISGIARIIKQGASTLTLATTNDYTGPTTLAGGTLIVHGSLANTPVTVLDGAVLAGTGIIGGTLTVNPGASLSPGPSLGSLTVSNTVALRGAISLELNKTSHTNDLLRGMTSLDYGGTLALTNLSGTLAPGDTFKCFDAIAYSGAFANLVPPRPGAGLIWDTTSLLADGTLQVAVAPRPVINSFLFTSGTLILGGTNGIPNASYYVLSSTNLALPLAQWTVVTTNTFAPSGAFSFTTTPTELQQFYLLQF